MARVTLASMVYIALVTSGGGNAQQTVMGSSGNATSNQTSLSLLQDAVVQLKLYLREEMVPDYIIDVLNKNLTEYNITVEEILQLAGLDNFNLDKTVSAVNHFNISLEKAFSVDTLELVLGVTKLQFKDFYNNLTQSLNLTSEVVRQSFLPLGIDSQRFTGALVFGLDNVYDVLRNGTFGQDNVTKALEAVNKTLPEIYEAALRIVYSEVIKLNSTDFMNSLKNLGFNDRIAHHLWKAFKITTYDLYRVEKFRNILEATSAKLNKDVTIVAVITGPSKLMIHKDLFDKISANGQSGIQTEQFDVTSQNQKLNSSSLKFVELEFEPSTRDFVEVATNFTNLGNCYYATFVADDLVITPITVEGNNTNSSTIVAKKGPSTTYSLGSPLICNNKLIGMAGNENASGIVFDTLYKESGNSTVVIRPPSAAGTGSTTPNQQSSSNRIYLNLVVVVNMFISFLLIL